MKYFSKTVFLTILCFGIFLASPELFGGGGGVAVAEAAVLFEENFEAGNSPFSFSAERLDNLFHSSELIGGCGDRGRCWKETFHSPGNNTYFGFYKDVNWLPSDTMFVKFYIKYGDANAPYQWPESHELKFPDFGPNGPDRIVTKHRPGSDQSHGRILIYSNQPPYNHALPQELVGDTWYCIEFMVSDGGDSDIVKIWKDKNNEQDPDYSFFSSTNMFNSNWESRAWEFGYRNHDVLSGQVVYFDDIVVANNYTGCGDNQHSDTTPPSAPSGLAVN